MAYLNVRERRIEAKIAYVGPARAGKATNVARLREAARGQAGAAEATPESGDAIAVAWRPTGAAFRDCDVVARVVVLRGADVDARLDDTLADVDGVVAVLDAHPLAQPNNRASLAAVRAALARSDRIVPVVVQVNKADVEEALPAVAVIAGLDAAGLSHVSASAARGEGVVETLEAALGEVLASMQREVASPAAEPEEAIAPEAGARGEGHPLLAALRQLLRDTVREHVADLEARLFTRLDGSMRRVTERLAEDQAARVELAKTIADVADVVMDVSHRTDALTDRAHTTLEAVRCVAPSLDAVTDALARSSTVTDGVVRALRAELAGTAAAPPGADVHARLNDIVREIRSWKRSPFD